ncbi:MAG TPA: acyltransferase family protein [Acidimicrobiales bacterium]|nr:acyltransferase family protein [Acidimicrobiales bacterium]
MIPYLPALDGLRALAVTAVLLYHAGVARAGGGFLGVDLFFVLSGFLITSLLVAERRRGGRISLTRFWARRARRLLPALFVMLAGVAAYAAFLAPAGSLADLRRAALATLGYGANWSQVVGGQGYFAQLAAPSPLLHTWSLAIEEQFYMVWPLLVTGLLALGRRRPLLPLVTFALGAAAASAGAMALLFHGGAGLDRVYYGTDTRAQDLLVGAALAAVLQMRPDPWAPLRSRPGRAALAAAGGAGLALLVASAVAAGGSSAWLYHGGFLGLAVGAAALLAAMALAPAGAGGRALAVAPVRYVGRISYGLYLWHWPLFLVLDHARTGLSGGALLAARLAASLAVAAASYHLLEVPIRRGALPRWRAWIGAPAAATGVAVAVVLATVAPAGASLASGAGGGAAAALLTAAGPPPAGPTTSGAGAVDAGTDPSVPAVPAGTGGPVRVLLVGDSSATVLALGFTPTQAFGVDLEGDAVIGCGLVTGGLVANRGTVSDETAGLRSSGHYVRCDTWPARWAADVARFHPDVVALMEGPWEVRDRYLGGRWTHLGQPGFDARELAALKQAVGVLGAGGARVALLTAPYDGQPEQPDGRPQPADDPARTDRYNQLLRQVAAGAPGRTAVVDLGRRLSPGGRFTPTMAGTTVRDEDGIHVTPAGARLFEPWLIESLGALSPRPAG